MCIKTEMLINIPENAPHSYQHMAASILNPSTSVVQRNNLARAYLGPGPLGPEPTWTRAHLGPGPLGPRAHLGPGPLGPGPTWAQGPLGPRPTWAQAHLGPGPTWAQAHLGPGPLGPGPTWAQAHLGPGLIWARAQFGAWDHFDFFSPASHNYFFLTFPLGFKSDAAIFNLGEKRQGESWGHTIPG